MESRIATEQKMEHLFAEEFRRIEPLYRRWIGGQAMLWEYTVAHMTLVVRIEVPGRRGNLHIRCGDVLHICGPTKWENVQLEIVRHDSNAVIVRDRAAGFEIRTGGLDAAENCKPIY
jgi:hypothetical protein